MTMSPNLTPSSIAKTASTFGVIFTPYVATKGSTAQVRSFDLRASSFYIGPQIDFATPSLLSLSDEERNVLRHFIGENDIILGFDGLEMVDMIERLLYLPSYVK